MMTKEGVGGIVVCRFQIEGFFAIFLYFFSN